MKKLILIFSAVMFWSTPLLLAQELIQNSIDDEATAPLMMFSWREKAPDALDGACQDREREERKSLLQERQLDDIENQEAEYELANRSSNPTLIGEEPIQEIDEALDEPEITPLDAQLVEALRRNRARNTLAALRALDIHNTLESPYSLWNFRTAEWRREVNPEGPQAATLLLNNKESPCYQRVSGADTQGRYTLLVPTIIAAGFPTYVDKNNQSLAVPMRVPTTEENQKIRRLIKEAFEIYYHCDDLQNELGTKGRDFYASLDAPESRDRPITVGEIKGLFDFDSNAKNHPKPILTKAIKPQTYKFFKENKKIFDHPEGDSLIDFAHTNPADERFTTIKTRQQAFDEIESRLQFPWRSLHDACWYYGEGIGNRVRLCFRSPTSLLPMLCTLPFISTMMGGCAAIVIAPIVWNRFTYPKYSSTDSHSQISPMYPLNRDMFNCGGHHLPLINKTIDIRDHVIGLNMYKEYAELRYRGLNMLKFTDNRFNFDFTGRPDWPRGLVFSNLTQYEKNLINQFHNEMQFGEVTENGLFVCVNLRRYMKLFPATTKLLISDQLDGIYANFGEPDWKSLREERINDEKELMEKYLSKEQQQKFAGYYDYLFNKNLAFHPGLYQPELIKRREELKSNMTPMLREYQGLDMEECVEIAEKKYKKKKAEEDKAKQENAEYEKEYKKADDRAKGRIWFAFKSGFGGGAAILTIHAFLTSVDSARLSDDPLIRKIDQAFYQASQSFNPFKEHIGIGIGIHETLLNSIKQAQESDNALKGKLERILRPGAEEESEGKSESKEESHFQKNEGTERKMNNQVLGESILQRIERRIQNRQGAIEALQKKVDEFNSRKCFIFTTRTPVASVEAKAHEE
ncbi:MAG: hypothetical protein K2W97_06205 [Chthoniobacterales bacterium]|nr:hypothetical protein [Chthoniobacterales bacterium]